MNGERDEFDYLAYAQQGVPLGETGEEISPAKAIIWSYLSLGKGSGLLFVVSLFHTNIDPWRCGLHD